MGACGFCFAVGVALLLHVLPVDSDASVTPDVPSVAETQTVLIQRPRIGDPGLLTQTQERAPVQLQLQVTACLWGRSERSVQCDAVLNMNLNPTNPRQEAHKGATVNPDTSFSENSDKSSDNSPTNGSTSPCRKSEAAPGSFDIETETNHKPADRDTDKSTGDLSGSSFVSNFVTNFLLFCILLSLQNLDAAASRGSGDTLTDNFRVYDTVIKLIMVAWKLFLASQVTLVYLVFVNTSTLLFLVNAALQVILIITATHIATRGTLGVTGWTLLGTIPVTVTCLLSFCLAPSNVLGILVIVDTVIFLVSVTILGSVFSKVLAPCPQTLINEILAIGVLSFGRTCHQIQDVIITSSIHIFLYTFGATVIVTFPCTLTYLIGAVALVALAFLFTFYSSTFNFLGTYIVNTQRTLVCVFPVTSSWIGACVITVAIPTAVIGVIPRTILLAAVAEQGADAFLDTVVKIGVIALSYSVAMICWYIFGSVGSDLLSVVRWCSVTIVDIVRRNPLLAAFISFCANVTAILGIAVCQGALSILGAVVCLGIVFVVGSVSVLIWRNRRLVIVILIVIIVINVLVAYALLRTTTTEDGVFSPRSNPRIGCDHHGPPAWDPGGAQALIFGRIQNDNVSSLRLYICAPMNTYKDVRWVSAA